MSKTGSRVAELRRELLLACSSEIVEKINPVEVLQHLTCLAEEDEDKIRIKSTSGSPHAAAQLLVHYLVDCCEQPGLWAELINAIRETNESLFNLLTNAKELETIATSSSVDPAPKATKHHQHYQLLRIVKRKLIEQLKPSEIMGGLIKEGVIRNLDMQEIHCLERSHGCIHAAMKLLTCIHKYQQNWFDLFLKVLDESEGYEDLAAEIRKLDPVDSDEDDEEVELEDQLEDACGKLNQLSFECENPPPSTPSSLLNIGMKNSKQDDDDDDDETDLKCVAGTTATGESPDGSSSVKDSSSRKPRKLRNYQHELTALPLEGKNAIVCAPTGSGKTMVALYIVKEHLDATEKGTRKVVFMGKTVPLVEQQYKQLEGYLTEYRVLKATGEDSFSQFLPQLVPDNDVIVLTPQVLENHLMESNINSVSVFSLLIFDECHHTRKGDPYNSIMDRYRNLKLAKTGEQLPQILGLTASLGVGGATNEYDAQTHIIELMANLDCENIVRVKNKKNLEELAEHVSYPETVLEEAPNRREDKFLQEIQKIMRAIEKKILSSHIVYYVDGKLTKVPDICLGQQYEQWVNKLAKETATEVHDDPKLAREIITCTDYLREYCIALDINKHARTKDALNHLMKMMKEVHSKRDAHDETDKELFHMFHDIQSKLCVISENDKNPRLTKLAATINKSFAEKGPDSRGILFVTTRASTIALHDWMKEDETLRSYQPERFTGAGASEDIGGMTQHDQEQILECFRQGEYRLLISTSVLEEGLDVPECNFIVRYCKIGNEISTVQTRGRNRAKDATSYMIAEQKHLAKEHLNMVREAMMYQAIAGIEKMDKESLRRNILRFQQKRKLEKMAEEKKKERKMAKKDNQVYKFLCGKCMGGKPPTPATDTSKMRLIGKNGEHHVVIDPEFESKYTKKQSLKRSKPIDGFEFKEIILCGKCGKEWGHIATCMGESYAMLSVKNFIILHPNGNKSTAKRWVDAPCIIEPLDLGI